MAKKSGESDVIDPNVNSASVALDTAGDSAAPAAPAAPTPDSPVAVDEFHGHGGSYVVDEATQTRRPNKE